MKQRKREDSVTGAWRWRAHGILLVTFLLARHLAKYLARSTLGQGTLVDYVVEPLMAIGIWALTLLLVPMRGPLPRKGDV